MVQSFLTDATCDREARRVNVEPSAGPLREPWLFTRIGIARRKGAAKQRRLGKTPRLMQTPKQIGRNDRLAGARRKRQKRPRRRARLFGSENLFERGTDGRILVITRFRIS
jgi:hypothetical protein